MAASAPVLNYLLLWVFALNIMIVHGLSSDKTSSGEDTTDRLKNLRVQMQNKGIQAYIIPAVDAHQSEYISKHDMRRKYISGFSGSAGTAIVTATKAALWTDGRYFLQAAQEMDDNWILQKQGLAGVPSITGWLGTELPKNSKVGVDPFLITIGSWDIYSSALKKKDITLEAVDDNLIDVIWTTDRPLQKAAGIIALGTEFTGRRWQDKIKAVREQLKVHSCTAIVLQKLDEIAWLFNMRGEDIDYNPVFFSYAIISQDKAILLADQSQIKNTDELRNHLRIGKCAESVDDPCITVLPYSGYIISEIRKLTTASAAKIWIPSKSSYAIKRPVTKDKLYLMYSPISLPKAIKNDVETKGMIAANIRDAVATFEFFDWAEQEVKKGSSDLTEMSAAAKLEEFKSKQMFYKGLSFPTIGGFGANAAVIHYTTSVRTDVQITDKNLFLLDCGFQFLDGTTDTTRTVHFGTPTQHQKDTFTRVLKGNLQIAMATFPNNTYGRVLDVLARLNLWNIGLDYRHGTGHGIGAYLNVHEGPQSIGTGFPRSAAEKPLMPGMFISDEPGYYEDGKFGIRIETIIRVVEKKTKYNFNNVTYIGFEPAAFVPYQRKMIEVSLLNKREVEYINNYYEQIRDLVGAEIKKQGKTNIYDWMMRETQPIEYCDSICSNTGHNLRHGALTLMAASLILTSLLIM